VIVIGKREIARSSTARACLGRPYQNLLVSLVLVVISGVVASAAHASACHRLDGNATAFETDGTRYAVWQCRAGFPIIVYGTLAWHRGELEDGCELRGTSRRTSRAT
jgi:hypothetical protein